MFRNESLFTLYLLFFVESMRIIILVLILIISKSSFGQVGGEQIFNFLKVSTSARQAALGGETLTLYDDVNQPLWNPSILNDGMDNQLSLNYVDFLTDINYGSLTFAHLMNEKFGTLHAGITYVNYGKLIAAEESGEITGTFQANDLAFSVAYAYRIPKSDFYTGANLKFISSTIENYTAYGAAMDIGLTYYNNLKPFVLTAVVRNIGYQISKFDEVRESLPLEIALGASYKPENVPVQWHLTLGSLQQWHISAKNPSDTQAVIGEEATNDDVSMLGNAIRHFVVGAEFFPDKKFNLRLGYNFRRARELRLTESRTFAGFSFGFGLKMRKFKLNYAFTKYHPAANTNTFSLKIDL